VIFLLFAAVEVGREIALVCIHWMTHLEVRRASLERHSLRCTFLEIAIESLVEESGVVTANSSKA
jgi:hypothetical protein